MDLLRSKARSVWVTIMKCVGREHQTQPEGKRLFAKPESTCIHRNQRSVVMYQEFSRLTATLSFALATKAGLKVAFYMCRIKY